MAMRRLATANILTTALKKKAIAEADKDTRNNPRAKIKNFPTSGVNPEIKRQVQVEVIPKYIFKLMDKSDG